MLEVLELFKSFVLGIIQGITEWLPISSTGHMLIFNSFFPLNEAVYCGGSDFVKLFVIFIQFGSMLAVVFLFFNKLNPFSRLKSLEQKKFSVDLWKKVVFGTVPIVVVGLVCKKFVQKFFYGNFIIALMLIVYGIFFLLIENYNNSFKIFSLDKLSYRTAMGIGLFQVLAIIPGTSRSGATILGALFLGCVREVGAEFSFFLSIPAITGASLVELLSYFKDNGAAGLMFNEIVVLLVGCVTAFFVSIFVISFLIKYIKTHDFKVFAYYRIVVGILIFGLIGLNVISMF